MPLDVQYDHVMDLELDYTFKAKSSIDHSRDFDAFAPKVKPSG